MKCPKCGREVISVISNINHPADILGCDECLPPELWSEDLIEVYDTDPEWLPYKEEEEEDEEDDDDIFAYSDSIGYAFDEYITFRDERNERINV